MKLHFPAALRVIGRTVVDWWDSWLDFVLVTVVWFLAQLTIVLGPPATFGFYYVAHQLTNNGQSLGVRGLITGGKKYFGKSLVWGLINLVALVVLVFNYQFYGNLHVLWAQYIQISIVTIIGLWLLTQFYGVAYLMELENPRIRTALRNGFFTTLAAPVYSFILFLFAAVVAVISVGLVLPLFLGLPAIIPLLAERGLGNLLIAFGIRKAELTPKQIEMEQGGRIILPQWYAREETHPQQPSDGLPMEGSGKQEETRKSDE